MFTPQDRRRIRILRKAVPILAAFLLTASFVTAGTMDYRGCQVQITSNC